MTNTKNKDLLTSVYVGLITFGLPVIVSDGFYNITATKKSYYYAVSLVFMGLILIRTFIRRRSINFGLQMKTGLLDKSFIIYLSAVILSSVLSEYDDVWTGSRSRYQGAITVILYVAVYFIVSRYLDDNSAFLTGAVGAIVIVSITGVLNCFDIDILGFYKDLSVEYKPTYISTIGNVNFYSSFMCLVLPLVVCGFCLVKTKLSTVIYTFAIVTGAIGSMVTSSESFVAGFAVAMVLIPLFISHSVYQLKRFIIAVLIMFVSAEIYFITYSAVPEKNVEISSLQRLLGKPIISIAMIIMCLSVLLILIKKPEQLGILKKIYCIALGFSVVLIAVLFIVANTSSLGFLDEYFRITDTWGSSRGAMWKHCFDLYKDFSIKEKLFGIGPESLYRITRPEVFETYEHINFKLDQAHNEYFQYLLTIGWTGLSAYLALIFSVCYTVIKWLSRNTLAIGVFAGLISFWVQATVNIAQPFTTPLMYIFICVTGALYYREKQQTLNTEKGRG